jgi:O-succinylbenzoic acid--CoA ligase
MPDAPAIVSAGKAADNAVGDAVFETSYAELDRRVSAVAGRLRGLGVGPGSRVSIYLPKSESYFVLLLALLRAGAVACPLSTRLPTGAVVPLLAGISADALVSEGEAFPETAGTLVEGIQAQTLLEDSDGAPSHGGPPERLALDCPATIVFTTGSTGTPKAALHGFGNHYYSALGSNANIALVPGDRWLHSLPLYHVGGLSIIFRSLISGSAMALPDPDALLGESIHRLRATHVSLVATQLRRLLSEDAPPSKLKAVLMGASAMPPALIDEAHASGLPLHTSYGLTELASQVTATPPNAPQWELHASGCVLPYREVSVAGDGEILVRGETLFAGYVSGDGLDPHLDDKGWFHTKDLGELSADGTLRVRGRKDNMFVSGGENVQPEEIEEALLRLPGVEEAAIVPVPDAEFGDRPVAFVRLARTDPPTDPREALERVLPRFKIPTAFHPWPPEAPTGMKVDRRFLRQRALLLPRET